MRPKTGEYFLSQIRRPVVKYLFALAMAGLSILFRFALNPLIGSGYQYVTVFPLIIVVAILVGRGPAILHALLGGALATWYFSVELDAASVLVTFIVILTGFLAGDLAQRLHNALAQAHQKSEELAESEQKFRLLAENAQAVIGIVQGDHFVYINPYFQKLSGYTADEVLNMEIWRLIHPLDRLSVLERAERRQAGEKVERQYEFRMLTKTGQTRWLDFSPVLISYLGKPAIVGIAFDITARKQAQEELRQTHGLLQGIAQGTNDMIAAVDHEFHFLFFNDAFQWEYKKLWGCDVQLHTSLLEPMARWPRQQQKARELWTRALKGETFNVTAEFGPDPENKYIYDIRYNPIYDTEGKRIGAAHIQRNITEQVQIQNELKESESFYRQTLESIPGMVFTTRPDGYCDYQSSQWIEYTGVPMEQMLGDGWNKLLHPDDRPRAFAAWRAAVEGKEPYDLEYRVRRFNGQYEWFKVRGRPIRDAAGKIVRWFGVATNISDLREAQEALAESEALFRGTFENAAVGITLVDLDGNWIDVNRRFCEMMGYSRQALMGSSFTIVTHPDDIEDDRRRFGQMKQGLMDNYFVEKRYIHHDGRMLWVDLYRAVQRDENGKPVYTIAVIIDITQRKRAEENLRQSEAKFRAVFEQAAIGMGRVRFEDARWIDVNDAFCAMLGYSRDEMLSTPWPQITHQDDVDLDLIPFKKLAKGEIDSYSVEKRFIHKQGHFVWARLTLSLVRDSVGGPDYETAVIEDITDRKNAEEALRESERRFRELADSMPQVVWSSRPDGVIDYFNRKWAEVTEGDLSKIGDEGWVPALPPDDVQRVKDIWYESISTGKEYYTELQLKVRGRDEYRWYIARALPIRDEQGNIVRWFGTATDIHDLKATQESLRKSEQQFRQLADSMPQIVWAARPDGTLDYYNRKWYELTKADPNAIGDQSWLPILHPEDRQKCLDVWYESVRTGKPYYIEYRFKFPDRDEYRWHIGRALPVRDEEGNIVRWFGTSTDIHELKQARDSLAVLKADLENKNKEMESIIGIVSHDLRAPLVNIQGFSHEIKTDCKALDTVLSHIPVEKDIEKQVDELLHHNIPESLQYIETSSNAMNNLVVTLVEVARAGLAPTRPERLNMSELMTLIVENLKIKFKEADVAYDIILPLPDCLADRTQVTQIFTNLLDNAVKYLDPSRRGQICVEGTPQAGGVLYWVSDNGIGIPSDQQEKIFEPYYQLKEKASGGVGMGLATVKKLIDRNNGKIWLISEKGKYSIFYVALPAPPAQTHEI